MPVTPIEGELTVAPVYGVNYSHPGYARQAWLEGAPFRIVSVLHPWEGERITRAMVPNNPVLIRWNSPVPGVIRAQ